MTTININNLTKSQLEDLEKQIAEAKNKLTTNYSRKRVKKYGEYFYFNGINPDVLTTSDDYTTSDNYRFAIGNYYLTQEEAIQARDRQLAIVRVNDAIDRLNEGWEHYNNNSRVVIQYNSSGFISNTWNCFYILPIIINLCKSKEIAEQIISEYNEDLKLIFKIK